MKIKANNGNFEPCPEYTGQAVCVDVTPLRKEVTAFGEREVFKIVFETGIGRTDGSRFCAWSRKFTPSLNEKANLRKFLRGWLGRDLTKEELDDFDTESLIGKPAQLVVVHEHKDGETYANIAACTPDRFPEPLKLCGRYVRLKDRTLSDASMPQAAAAPIAPTPRAATGGAMLRAPAPAAPALDLGATKIHVGRCKGLEVRQLSADQAALLIDIWLPTAKANAKATPDDRRLVAALEAWETENVIRTADDDVPF